MATITGRATIFGFAGSASWSGIGTLILQNGEFTHEFDKEEIRDADNDPLALIFSGERYRAKLQFTPVSDGVTNTIANAASGLSAPAMGATVTLASMSNSDFDAADWVYSGGWRQVYSRDGVVTYELEIERGVANDLSGAVS